jgi:hypothetical protein
MAASVALAGPAPSAAPAMHRPGGGRNTSKVEALRRSIGGLTRFIGDAQLFAQCIDRKPGSPLRISVAAQINLSCWPRSAFHWQTI